MQIIAFGVKENELSALGNLVGSLEVNDVSDATEPFIDFAHSFMSDSLDDLFEESIVFDNGEDLAAANKTLTNMIDEKFTSWQVSPSNTMIDEIIDAYDVPSRMKRYFEEDEENYVSPQVEKNRLEALGIDDLFSRDR